MSKKVVFVGPAEVGKSTLRKWIFEGESVFKLLENPLEPTYGVENFNYEFIKNLGVFDLAGQELASWFAEERAIFAESDLILNVIDVNSSYDDIFDYIQKALEIQATQEKKAIIAFFIHKIDLLKPPILADLKDKLGMLQKTIKKQEKINFRLYFTSIKPDFIFDTVNIFIDILKEINLEAHGFNVDSLRTNWTLFHTLESKDGISQKKLLDQFPEQKLKVTSLIKSYSSNKLIKIKTVDETQLIYLTEKGKKYYDSILSSFEGAEAKTDSEMAVEALRSHNQALLQSLTPEALIYGILISDDTGKTLSSVETQEGSLDNALKQSDDSQFDLELIPMFLNAMSSFAEEINIQDLSSFRLRGGNLKISALTKNNLIMTVFINPLIDMDYIIDDLKALFDYFVDEYEEEFAAFSKTGNATKFADFIPKAENELIKCGKKYKNIIQEIAQFDIEKVKEKYSQLNKVVEIDFTIQEKLKLNSLKVQLLEAIISEDFRTLQSLEKDLQTYLE